MARADVTASHDSLREKKPNRNIGVFHLEFRETEKVMYQPIDYIAAGVVATMILGPLSTGQSQVSHSGAPAAVTQQQ